MSEFVNKVAESGIVTINLEQYISQEHYIVFDLKPFLFMEMILKEKDYREALKNYDWSVFENKIVCILCSVDAIIPQWAFMLATTYLQPIAKDIRFGNVDTIKIENLRQAIQNIDTAEYLDKRIVIKGCGEIAIPDEAYIAITHKLLPVAKSIMYGEPCSTVPIYKRKG